MPLRADRIVLERALRAVSLGLLAFCAWAMIQDAPTHGRTDAQHNAIARSLRSWTRERPGDSLHLALRTAPGPVQRDWLKALSGAGTAITWSGAVPATAVEVVPLADPAGGARVLAAAPAAAWVYVADSLGVLDSVHALRGGAAFTLAAAPGALTMRAGGQAALAAGAESVAPRHAVVLGRAGWEARFVLSALEERGWVVDARLAVAPGIAMTQGRVFPLDTARQAVVVALDSLAPADAAALQRFTLNGGGVVLGAAAARSARAFAAGGVGPHLRAPLLTFAAGAPRRALALDPILAHAGTVVLEREGTHAVLAARRAGAGRVVQVGYDETWRWRMANLADAVDAHREWWAGVVAAAAYRSEIGDRRPETGTRRVADPAPLASLVAALGPARPAAAAAGPRFDPRTLLLPAASLLFLCLLAEVASRRLRGGA